MNNKFYSSKEFADLREKLNQEILRRSTYKWWDPLATPTVGEDRSQPLSIPDDGDRYPIDDKTYTINTPSDGSIEPTRNIIHPLHGDNPANSDHDSSSEFNVDEARNFLVGLSKIQDINLFYGRDEVKYLAYRDPKGIEDTVNDAEKSLLNVPLHESDISPTKNDPNGGIKDYKNPNYPVEHEVTYPMENGKYIMPSGEFDGEELLQHEGLSKNNFYDDYGAQPGDDDFHPYNRYISPLVRRDWDDQGHNRDELPKKVREGGLSSIRFGTNPRNPNIGNEYRPRPVYGGKKGSCIGACTGLCYVTCDNECSESCSTTCFNRCGNSCTSTCGNSCTSCSSLCSTGCKTKCENSTGYSCVKSGAKAVKIYSTGGNNGEPAKNNIKVTTHSCTGCSFSCQFYPNKKTECWDSGCMGKCFTSCTNSCSTSCFGGCIDNSSDSSENYNYKTGKGRGCSDACTLNCIGICSGVCEGYCIQTCWHACKQQCSDNCSWTCSTKCGDGCATGCTNGCKGCSTECSGSCANKAEDRTCIGCGAIGGCTSNCQFDCNKHCIGQGCRNICGVDSAGACESNCRLNCTGTSCTAMCSDACSNQCTTCVNTCGFQCGTCAGRCSVGCGQACNVNCTEECSQNCHNNCVQSCSQECGGCSNLCYSCIGMCIGICSVKCSVTCSSCTNTCGWWCDAYCNRDCLSNCSSYCIQTCVGSCSTHLMSDTKLTEGPERDPIAQGYIYPHPKNRWEERESFKLIRDIEPFTAPSEWGKHKLITITIIKNKHITYLEMDIDNIVEKVQRVYEISDTTLTTNDGIILKNNIINVWKSLNNKYVKYKPRVINKGDYIYRWDINTLGEFSEYNIPEYLDRDRSIVVIGPNELEWNIKQSTETGGIYNVDPTTGEITIDEDMLDGVVSENKIDLDIKGSIFIITLYTNGLDISEDDIEVKLPFEFDTIKSFRDKNNNIIVVIKRMEFLLPSERNENNGKD